MALELGTSARNAWADAIDTEIGSSGQFNVYSGTVPTTVSGAISGLLLAELTLSSPAFGAAAAGVLTANSITSDASANNTGVATFGRLTKSDGTPVVQFTMGESGDSPEAVMDDKNITQTGNLSVDSGGTDFTITIPES